MYEKEHVDALFRLWKPVEYHATVHAGGDFNVYVKDAGHILGSAMFEVTHLLLF